MNSAVRLIGYGALVFPLLAAACRRDPAPAVVETAQPAPAAADRPDDRLDKLIADETEAIRQHPEQANDRGELPHHRRARAYAEKGDADKAVADFTEAIRLYEKVKPPYVNARLPEAYFGRGESYRKKHDYDAAIADFTKIIDTSPITSKDIGEALAFGGFRATALSKRGVCYDEKGDHAKAMADFEEAVRLAPELERNEDLKRRMKK